MWNIGEFLNLIYSRAHMCVHTYRGARVRARAWIMQYIWSRLWRYITHPYSDRIARALSPADLKSEFRRARVDAGFKI